ncbi:hypothetical protein M3699_10975 [Peribacillus simplex]|uniref:hypothetical protein n=1 Tax=Peribacillus simplex TaxID=1478 RepID=UPI00203BA1DA|nr:hypothetical protein [Peribacillus simplex]MCM3674394.1 hypothetical protein [Peribacillus simplex]
MKYELSQLADQMHRIAFEPNTRKFHAFTREFGANTREFHAFTREFGANTRKFHAFTRVLGANTRVSRFYS